MIIAVVTDCDLPAVEVSLEQSEYIVSEGIGRSNRALQICAVARDTLFPVTASFSVQNGSAIGKELLYLWEKLYL